MNTSYQKKYNRVIPVVTLIIMIAVFIFSYSFIIQPHYDAPKDEIASNHLITEFSSEDSYLVENSDGTYTLYYSDEPISEISPDSAKMMIDDGFTVRSQK